MKKIFAIATILFGTIQLNAQNSVTMSNKIEQPYIEVTGSAEKEIEPDIIYLAFSLTKYENEKNKEAIEVQEKKMLEELRKADIDTKLITLSNTSGSDAFYYKKKNKYQEQKSYKIKLADAQTVGKVYEILTDLKANNIYVASVDHTKMQEYKLQIKQEAVKAAKTKATAMAGAINETVGKVLFIQEVDGEYNPVPMYANAVYKMEDKNGGEYEQDSDISFEKIKLNCKVNTRFELIR